MILRQVLMEHASRGGGGWTTRESAQAGGGGSSMRTLAPWLPPTFGSTTWCTATRRVRVGAFKPSKALLLLRAAGVGCGCCARDARLWLGATLQGTTRWWLHCTCHVFKQRCDACAMYKTFCCCCCCCCTFTRFTHAATSRHTPLLRARGCTQFNRRRNQLHAAQSSKESDKSPTPASTSCTTNITHPFPTTPHTRTPASTAAAAPCS